MSLEAPSLMFCQHLPGHLQRREPCGRRPRTRSPHESARSRAAVGLRLPGADWRQLMMRIVMVVLLILGLGSRGTGGPGESAPHRSAAKASAAASGELEYGERRATGDAAGHRQVDGRTDLSSTARRAEGSRRSRRTRTFLTLRDLLGVLDRSASPSSGTHRLPTSLKRSGNLTVSQRWWAHS